MPDNQQGIGEESLQSLLTLLGGGGTAAAINKGILVSPAALRAMGGARSMHPAVAENIGWGGSLKHPLAIKTQRALDEQMMQDYENMKSAPLSEIHNQFGWGHGPVMGLSKEIPDIGLNVKKPPYKNSETSSNIMSHSDLGSNLNSMFIPGGTRWAGPLEGSAYYPTNRSIQIDRELLKPREEYLKNNYAFDSHAEQMPYETKLKGQAAHELQHAGQDQAEKLVGRYDWTVPHSEREHEREARGAEFRAMHPEAYKFPFDMTATYNYPEFLQILDALKRK